MIKARGKAEDGRHFLILGLSRKNTEALLEGLPIAIDTVDLGVTDGPHILLVAGETEEDIQTELKNHFNLPPAQVDPSDATKH